MSDRHCQATCPNCGSQCIGHDGDDHIHWFDCEETVTRDSDCHMRQQLQVQRDKFHRELIGLRSFMNTLSPLAGVKEVVDEIERRAEKYAPARSKEKEMGVKCG